jgi:putative acetyltransferase
VGLSRTWGWRIDAVTIRPEGPTDHDAVRALLTRTMRPNEAERVDLVRASEGYVPGLALVLERPEGMLGFVLLSWVTLDGGPRRSVLALAPLCVRPDHQRGGLGSALVRAALSSADALGAPLVRVLGDPAYYRRFGFEPAHRHGVRPPADGFPPGAFQVRLLSRYRGELRGRVVYPPAFEGTWS